MSKVVVIGCGVVGAAIAYELSGVPGLEIAVLDRQPPAQAATGAALGVLMGVVSHKVKGRAWQMRQASMQRYETLIPELEALTAHKIPFNQQGIVSICFQGEDLAAWQKLAEVRRSQGWQLEIWDAAQLHRRCPQIVNEKIIGAIYSPQDRQVDPTALTSALVAAAQRRGVTFNFGSTVVGVDASSPTCKEIHTTTAQIAADWFVVAAGLGSAQLAANWQQSLDIRPVLGQALHLQLPGAIAAPKFQPVVTGNDVHIVPLSERECWVGATVEFPTHELEVLADVARLQAVQQQAISFCPILAEATIVKTWSGLRPRPTGQGAPVVGQLQNFSNVLLATGHYRNGVLLAPATAQIIRQLITPHP